jgi:hypothetical protein
MIRKTIISMDDIKETKKLKQTINMLLTELNQGDQVTDREYIIYTKNPHAILYFLEEILRHKEMEKNL